MTIAPQGRQVATSLDAPLREILELVAAYDRGAALAFRPLLRRRRAVGVEATAPVSHREAHAHTSWLADSLGPKAAMAFLRSVRTVAEMHLLAVEAPALALCERILVDAPAPTRLPREVARDSGASMYTRFARATEGLGAGAAPLVLPDWLDHQAGSGIGERNRARLRLLDFVEVLVDHSLRSPEEDAAARALHTALRTLPGDYWSLGIRVRPLATLMVPPMTPADVAVLDFCEQTWSRAGLLPSAAEASRAVPGHAGVDAVLRALRAAGNVHASLLLGLRAPSEITYGGPPSTDGASPWPDATGGRDDGRDAAGAGRRARRDGLTLVGPGYRGGAVAPDRTRPPFDATPDDRSDATPGASPVATSDASPEHAAPAEESGEMAWGERWPAGPKAWASGEEDGEAGPEAPIAPGADTPDSEGGGQSRLLGTEAAGGEAGQAGRRPSRRAYERRVRAVQRAITSPDLAVAFGWWAAWCADGDINPLVVSEAGLRAFLEDLPGDRHLPARVVGVCLQHLLADANRPAGLDNLDVAAPSDRVIADCAFWADPTAVARALPTNSSHLYRAVAWTRFTIHQQHQVTSLAHPLDALEQRVAPLCDRGRMRTGVVDLVRGVLAARESSLGHQDEATPVAAGGSRDRESAAHGTGPPGEAGREREDDGAVAEVSDQLGNLLVLSGRDRLAQLRAMSGAERSALAAAVGSANPSPMLLAAALTTLAEEHGR